MKLFVLKITVKLNFFRLETTATDCIYRKSIILN